MKQASESNPRPVSFRGEESLFGCFLHIAVRVENYYAVIVLCQYVRYEFLHIGNGDGAEYLVVVYKGCDTVECAGCHGACPRRIILEVFAGLLYHELYHRLEFGFSDVFLSLLW